ncbi:Acylamino-acid-releasing enzyme [Labilithrix luteola]|uniref:Acylamino-acid-releasing enzyme n=1 Tax=Labilithrix luteola TaxID=1391654 RepID=A0A0K1PQ68_9BACT|nr:prolyl oligopeptidase family serine peptidase [Labilithrix luteola]AKU95244.1 Acylamino-acid-releasing enzyme [Labilithrix luteola]
MRRSLQPISSLLVLGLIASSPSSVSCAHPAPPNVPPLTTALVPPEGGAASSGAPSSGGGYAGHGSESVSPEILAKYAPTPLPPQVSRRIQSMLDVRAPMGTRLAPDGKTLYFGWTVTGTAQVWKADGPKHFPTQLTGGEDVTRMSGVTPDGKWLVISRDRKGEENPGLYLMPASGGPMREVQHTPKVQTQLAFVSDDGKWLYYRANDKKPDSYAIYRWEIASGKRETVFAEDGLWNVDDHRGDKLLLTKATGALTAEYWEWDEAAKKLTPLFGQGEKEEYNAMYAAGPGELLVQTPKFGDFRRLYRVKQAPLTGKPLEASQGTAITPDVRHDVSSFFIDRARTHVYYQLNDEGFTRAHVLDAKTYAETKLPSSAALADATHVTFGAPSWSGRWAILNVGSAKAPTASYVLDWQTNELTPWVSPSTPEVETSRFAVAKLEYYPARDGTRIPMFVRRPAACEKVDSGCPVVIQFHGGPEGQAIPGFNVYAQLFVDAGFVFVEPNVRGSDGYGKAWLHADDGPKRLSVITDIEDASKFVRTAWVKDGKAPKVGIIGGSYGGYSTLIGMTMFAGAYDAGVANVGMSNLLTFLLNTAPYRRTLRASEYGDPEKDREALMKLSPVTYIDRLSAPLLLLQGASDPRVPVGEAIQMHDALEKRGIDAKLVIFADEGHGTQKRENKVIEIGKTIDFLDKHLKPSANDNVKK